jgi:hypothetical protein
MDGWLLCSCALRRHLQPQRAPHHPRCWQPARQDKIQLQAVVACTHAPPYRPVTGQRCGCCRGCKMRALAPILSGPGCRACCLPGDGQSCEQFQASFKLLGAQVFGWLLCDKLHSLLRLRGCLHPPLRAVAAGAAGAVRAPSAVNPVHGWRLQQQRVRGVGS